MTNTPVLNKAELEKLEEQRFVHPFNDKAVMHVRALGEAAGFTLLGVRLMRVEAGDETTCYHNHELSDEFVYIISGTATLTVGEARHELKAGDFAGFPANGPAHVMQNTGSEDLVYLVAGNRPDIDIANYPRNNLRLYKVGNRFEYMDLQHVQELQRKK